jgi:hypothetical protein
LLLNFNLRHYTVLRENDVDGKVLFGLTVEQAQNMGLSMGTARQGGY